MNITLFHNPHFLMGGPMTASPAKDLVPVAEFEIEASTDDLMALEDVWVLTNTVEKYWIENTVPYRSVASMKLHHRSPDLKRVRGGNDTVVPGPGWRSTSVGDVACLSDPTGERWYQVAAFGWNKINAPTSFLLELPEEDGPCGRTE